MKKALFASIRQLIPALISIFFCVNAFAALPPWVIEDQLKNAEEKIYIEVLKTTVTPDGEYRYDVRHEAKVVAVEVSASGLVVGDIVLIDSFFNEPPIVGPQVPEILPVGWVGKAYLNSQAGSEWYDLAANGHSFVKEEPPVNVWNATTVYYGGDIVSYNGQTWKARYWTYGDTPTVSDWGPWELQ